MVDEFHQSKTQKSWCLWIVLHRYSQKGQDENNHRLAVIIFMVPGKVLVSWVIALCETALIATSGKGWIFWFPGWIDITLLSYTGRNS